jgi:hypothetical protein
LAVVLTVEERVEHRALVRPVKTDRLDPEDQRATVNPSTTALVAPLRRVDVLSDGGLPERVDVYP